MNSTSKTKRKANPRQNANPLYAATFLYTLPTFIKGHRKPFEEEDIYETITDLRSEHLGNKVEVLWRKSCRTDEGPSLLKVLISVFGIEYITWGFVLAILELILKPAQAVFLGQLLLHYMPSVEEGSRTNLTEARWYAGGIVLLSVLRIALFHPLMVHSQLVGLKVKIACCSLIYRKALKLNNAAFDKTSLGQMINLLSNDVIIFTKCALMLNYLWVGPLQCFVVIYLMYCFVGLSSIFGVLLLFLFIPMYYLLGNLASKYRSRAALRTDDRVCYMNELLSGIDIIKMHAWEKLTTSLMLSLRNLEMKCIRLSLYVKATYLSFDILIIPIVLYVTIVVYVFHNHIRADKVFTLTIFYNSLRLSMATFFPQALGLRGEALVSIKRIQDFLLNTEIQLESIESTTDPIAVEIIDGSAKWKEDLTLKNINFSVKPGRLVAIVGPVGCGKSSLLNVMLKELQLVSGKIYINGDISYASQDAWLFCASVRDNILFGEQMDTDRYNEVVRICALQADFKTLPFGDHTMVGGRGASLSGGQKARINLARAVYRNSDIYLLDDPFASVDARVAKQVFDECIRGFLKGKTVILVTHHILFLKDVDQLVVLENGTIISQDSKVDDKGGLDHSTAKDDLNEDELNRGTFRNNETDKIQNITKEQKSVGSVSIGVYRRYISSCGWLPVFNVAILFLVTQTLISGGSYFLTYWVNKAQMEDMALKQDNTSIFIPESMEYNQYSNNMYIYLYSLITAMCIIIVSIRSYTFYSLSLNSSEKLHNNMFKNVIGGTMRFFNTNAQGRIINRFSQDMGTVDTLLPTVAIDTTQLLLYALASVILIAVVNYWLLIPTIVIGAMAYGLKTYCLLTSRNIKRLEGVTRSPVFEHLSSSLQGLSTVRAFQAEAILREEFDIHQDLHSGCYHLFLTTSQGFGYFLDCICAVYLAIVTLSFVISDHELLGGNVGLAVTECLSVIGILQWAMQQTADLENNMTCVERILEYDSVEQEESGGVEVSTTWPEVGEIVFRNVTLQYLPDAPPTLKNLSFQVSSKEKIGIIGRTGAGKTSIANALLRLTPISGEILIDGVDTKSINLQALRSKISVIPQDPTLFSGTLRQNLDPFQEYEDSALWNVLEDVELKELFASSPQGLCHVISQGGKNVSVGQRQLICLARAILRNNKILIMDEATANVDLETDTLIQRTIRKKFESCTVLTIAHRLQTVLDSDKILVMSEGEVVEFDKPSVLLNNDNGYFYKMSTKLNK
uniref:Multidrug resistance-associated protein lethal(2)03659 n=1 Tax=Photinus pyralis TaxID=7054 RepID=A0A1Y1KXE9_PHOPY